MFRQNTTSVNRAEKAPRQLNTKHEARLEAQRLQFGGVILTPQHPGDYDPYADLIADARRAADEEAAHAWAVEADQFNECPDFEGFYAEQGEPFENPLPYDGGASL